MGYLLGVNRVGQQTQMSQPPPNWPAGQVGNQPGIPPGQSGNPVQPPNQGGVYQQPQGQNQLPPQQGQGLPGGMPQGGQPVDQNQLLR